MKTFSIFLPVHFSRKRFLPPLKPCRRPIHQCRVHQRYQIAVCDWMILKRQKLGAFQLAKDLGADGVEVDMGCSARMKRLSAPSRPTRAAPAIPRQGARVNLGIPSLAMSGFYAQSFAERTTVRADAGIALTDEAMNVKIAFCRWRASDLLKHPEFVECRRAVESHRFAGGKAGVVIGVETEIPAADQVSCSTHRLAAIKIITISQSDSKRA